MIIKSTGKRSISDISHPFSNRRARGLAHAAGDATELAYRRGDALDKRRRVMEAWADFCSASASRRQRDATASLGLLEPVDF
jgi:hypothetical protein